MKKLKNWLGLEKDYSIGVLIIYLYFYMIGWIEGKRRKLTNK